MTTIPQPAIDAVRAIYPRMPVHVVIRILEAAEMVWPHNPPKRDPASTVTGALNLAASPARLPSAEAPSRPGFGFGPPAVRS